MADKRSEESKSSVKSLHKLLKEVCKSPDKYCDDDSLKKALKSQGALYARYDNMSSGIKSSSINTAKRAAAEIIAGGFEELDKLRIGARDRIEAVASKSESPNKRTRRGLQKLAQQYEKDIDSLRKVNFALLQAITDVSGDIRSVANTNNESVRKERSQQTIRKLMAMLAMNPAPYNELLSKSNIKPIKSE